MLKNSNLSEINHTSLSFLSDKELNAKVLPKIPKDPLEDEGILLKLKELESI